MELVHLPEKTWIFRKLFAKHWLPIRQRIAQLLSIQIEKGVLSGDKLGNDLQRILKQLKNYDSMLLVCTHCPAIKNLIKKTSNPLVNYLIQLMNWWNWFSKYGQVNKIQLKRYLCPQVRPEQLKLFRYNSKKVFDVYISKVYPVVQDEMDFTF